MPVRRRRGIQRARALSHDQFIELQFGGYPDTDAEAFAPTTPPRRRSAFSSPFVRKAAWSENRGDLMAGCNAGSRPWAWWLYEGGTQPPYPSGPQEVAALARLNVLSEAEVAELASWARLTGAEK